MTWNSINPVVHLITKIYENGKRLLPKQMKLYEERIDRAKTLGKWDVTICHQTGLSYYLLTSLTTTTRFFCLSSMQPDRGIKSEVNLCRMGTERAPLPILPEKTSFLIAPAR